MFGQPTEGACPGTGEPPAKRIPGTAPAGLCPVCGGGFVVDLDGLMVVHRNVSRAQTESPESELSVSGVSHERGAGRIEPMTERHNPIEVRRFEDMVNRLEEDLINDSGEHVSRQHVETILTRRAHDLADAPVQDFVPLLAEHGVRDELRNEGFRPAPEPEPEDHTPVPAGDEDDSGLPWTRGVAFPT
jgi:hypothetical protein